MVMKDIHCPVCGEGNKFRVRYQQDFDKSALDFVGRKTPDHMHFRIVQCRTCGLRYSNPILSKEEIVELYRRSDFIQEPQLKNMVSDYVGEFKKIAHLIKGRSILEVGCSNGFFL